MRSLGQHIRAQRRSLGLTLERLSVEAGCTKGYLSAIETGRRERPPSDELLVRLERALRMAPGSLLEQGRWQSTPEEIRRTVRGLERRTKAAARLAELVLLEGRSRGVWSKALESLAESMALTGSEETAQAPVINRVEDGYPTGFTDWSFPWRRAIGYVSAPVELSDEAYAVRVVGDAMLPEYAEGDVAILDPGRRVWPGADCLARLRGGTETTFRRVYFERDGSGRDLVRLQPTNSAHAPRLEPAEEVTGLDPAVYVLRRAPGSEAGSRGEGEVGASRPRG